MGVQGLWKLVEPAGKPVPLESLENKVLAVDVSIWLHQATKGFRDANGQPLANAHLLGLFHRICKLMFYKIKPVFVFDGGVPPLKKQTLASRRIRKEAALSKTNRLQEKLFSTLVQSELLGRKDDMLLKLAQNRQRREKDLFELPSTSSGIPAVEGTTDERSLAENVSGSDSEVEEDEYRNGSDFNIHSVDIDASEFRALPASVQHDILTDLRETRKQNSWGKLYEMPQESPDFSSFQMERLLRRRKVQERLEKIGTEAKEANRLRFDEEAEGFFVETNRIASDATREYVFMKKLPQVQKSAPKIEIKKEYEEEKEISQEEIMTMIKDDTGLSLDSSDEFEEVASSAEKPQELLSINLNLKQDIKDDLFDDIFSEIKGPLSIFDQPPSSSKACLVNTGISLMSIGRPEVKKVLQEIQEKIKNKNAQQVRASPQDLSMQVGIISDDSSESDLEVVNDNTEKLDTRELEKGRAKDEEEVQEMQEKTKGKNIQQVEVTSPKFSTELGIICDESSENDVEKVAETNFELDQKVDTDEHGKDEIKLLVKDIPKVSVDEVVTENALETTLKTLIVPRTEKVMKDVLSVNKNPSEIVSSTYISDTGMGHQQIGGLKQYMDTPYRKDTFIRTESRREEESNATPEKSIALAKSFIVEAEVSNLEVANSQISNVEPSTITTSTTPVKAKIDEVPSTSVLGNLKTEEPALKKLKIGVESSITTAKSPLKTPNKRIEEALETRSFWKLTEEVKAARKEEEQAMEEANEVSASLFKRRSLTEEETDRMQAELEIQQRDILKERGKQERLATSITDQMYLEAQELLRLFGIPYVVAPMEAEAQCAFLDMHQLTQGTITDDSDIWLFGGKRVYKNFFNQTKYVEFFNKERIEQIFRLDRDKLICLALLTGCDYTEGIESIGPVTALEILSEFPGHGINSLKAFKSWLESQRSKIAVNENRIRRKLKEVKLTPDFPNEVVVMAYLHPEVDESEERFTWGEPNESALRNFAREKFGWSAEKIDELLVPTLAKWKNKQSQMRIDSYFSVQFDHNVKMSKRVLDALNRGSAWEHDENDVSLPLKEERLTRRRKRRKVEEAQIEVENGTVEGEEAVVHEASTSTSMINVVPDDLNNGVLDSQPVFIDPSTTTGFRFFRSQRWGRLVDAGEVFMQLFFFFFLLARDHWFFKIFCFEDYQVSG
ncbi:DNA excision repair protein ERCC-5-like isoform X2 [Artemia franciscana]|uniref:DNA excision repair protein ERCC-5-like isoform X2 n=1 Tax=Artemia franciscana TaxID=6661 RepID=UPI0032DA56E0